MSVYFYGRCSAEENFNKGSSIETQITKCQSYATMKDLIVDEVISKSLLIPPTDFVNLKIGKLVRLEEIVYTSVAIPPIVPDSLWEPNNCPDWLAAFNIEIICSL